MVSSTKEVIDYEADQRHAEIMKEQSKGVNTPAVNDEGGAVDGGEVNETLYRAIAARANYLAQDRPDTQVAAQKVSRFMSRHEAIDFTRARKLGRYLMDDNRVAFNYRLQRLPETVVVWSGTDFAGCRRTCRSTSG